jgi:hypothetical protein
LGRKRHDVFMLGTAQSTAAGTIHAARGRERPKFVVPALAGFRARATRIPNGFPP